MALLAVESIGLLIWFSIPRFRAGEFGGTFTIPIEQLPEVNGEPANFPDVRLWLVNLDARVEKQNKRMYKMKVKLMAIDPVCGMRVVEKTAAATN
jgi:hypothetical protein